MNVFIEIFMLSCYSNVMHIMQREQRAESPLQWAMLFSGVGPKDE